MLPRDRQKEVKVGKIPLITPSASCLIRYTVEQGEKSGRFGNSCRLSRAGNITKFDFRATTAE